MTTNIITGTYGSNKTPCFVYVVKTAGGLSWYAVDGSSMVNATYDDLRDGVDVECLEDVDCFTTNEINSIEELDRAVND